MARILIIDDEPQIRAMLWQLLGREGYDVELGTDGNGGLEICRSKPIDLVITDIFMPGKEGIQTIKDLNDEFPHIPIIAVSGGGNVSGHPLNLLKAARLMGATTFEKPVDRDKLLKAVRERIGPASN